MSERPSPQDVANEAMDRLSLKITDLVFQEIQNDRELMQKYLQCVEKPGLKTTNTQIGKAVKARYDLPNLEPRNDEPISTLIQSFQPH